MPAVPEGVRWLLLFLIIQTLGTASGFHVLNAGNETVYRVKVRVLPTSPWSADLLGVTSVIEVGEDRLVELPPNLQTCRYDVRFEYRDGHASEIDGVDLCREQRLRTTH